MSVERDVLSGKKGGRVGTIRVCRSRRRESTAGNWITADKAFWVYRVGARWVLGCRVPDMSEWMCEHGFHGPSFPTRRAALERLQDALAVDPPTARLWVKRYPGSSGEREA